MRLTKKYEELRNTRVVFPCGRSLPVAGFKVFWVKIKSWRMLTVIAGCTGILGDLPSLAGIPQVLLCPSGTICTWEHGCLLSSVWADTDDLLKRTWGHPAGKGLSPVAVRWSQSRCLLRTCPKTHWIYPAFSQSLLSQDKAPSAFVVG